MLRHRFDRAVGCRQNKPAMLLSSNTRVAKDTGDAQKHEKCLVEWMKRSKVSWSKPTRFWGMSFYDLQIYGL